MILIRRCFGRGGRRGGVMIKRFFTGDRMKNNRNVFGAFGATFILLVLFFMYAGIFPTGQKSILISDMFGQYYDFLTAFKRIITEHRSLVYSWDLGMGSALLPWIAYYVSSPFNLLLLLVPDALMIWGVTFLIIIKLSMAAMAFAVFSKKVLKQQGIESVVFACCYGMCGYAVTYHFSIMWLDFLFFLPILLIQIKKLVDSGRMAGVTICLAVMFVANYYMSYMTGIFSLICLTGYYFYQKKAAGSSGLIKYIGKLAACAALAAAAAGALLVPTVYQMIGRLGGEGNSPGVFQWKLDVPGLYNNALFGSYTTLEYGKPLIYTGTLVLLLLPFFFLTKRIAPKDKIIAGALLGVMAFIMICPYTDLIMHIGSEPTWFLYRYSFFLSFILACIGCRGLGVLLAAFREGEGNSALKMIALTGAVHIILISLVYAAAVIQKQTGYVSGFNMGTVKYCGNLILFPLFWCILFYGSRRKTKRKDLSAVLLLGIGLELVINGVVMVNGIDTEVGYRDTQQILEKKKIQDSLLDQIPEQEEFYRVEKNFAATFNDAVGAGYHGISNFTSVYNPAVTNFLYNIGIWSHDWHVLYSGSTEFSDAVFGIRYKLHNDGKQRFEFVSEGMYGEPYLETKENYLPIGFLVGDEVGKLRFGDNKSVNVLENICGLWTAMTDDPEAAQCFTRTEPADIKLSNARLIEDAGFKIYEKIDKAQDASVTYEVDIKQGESTYFYFRYDNSGSGRQKHMLDATGRRRADRRFIETENCEVPFNLGISPEDGSKDGQEQVSITFGENDRLILEDEIFYTIDRELFSRYCEKLNRGGLKVSGYGDGYLEGTIEVPEDRLMFTSIPYDPGWKVFVDGKQVSCTALFDKGFIGVELKQGVHRVRFEYFPKGLKLGAVISVTGLVLLAILTIFEKNRVLDRRKNV